MKQKQTQAAKDASSSCILGRLDADAGLLYSTQAGLLFTGNL